MELDQDFIIIIILGLWHGVGLGFYNIAPREEVLKTNETDDEINVYVLFLNKLVTCYDFRF